MLLLTEPTVKLNSGLSHHLLSLILSRIRAFTGEDDTGMRPRDLNTLFPALLAG